MNKKVKTNCYFCEKNKIPSYKEVDEIAKFVSERARIVGLCRPSHHHHNRSGSIPISLRLAVPVSALVFNPPLFRLLSKTD